MTGRPRPVQALLDSPAWRRIGRSARGRELLRSDLAARIHRQRRKLSTTVEVLRHPEAFRETRTVLLFIGHVKSGGSLLGALLDAHPDAIVADEIDVLRLVEEGFRRDHILHLLARGARREATKGRVTARRLEAYSLAVPGQWQGRVRTPLVVGDSRAGPTTRRAGDDVASVRRHLAALDATMAPLDVRFVHVVRDPRDPISAMVLRSGRSLDDAVRDHAEQCDRLVLLRAQIPAHRLLTVHYETLIDAPRATVAALCAHVGLPEDDAHLDACAALVRADRAAESSKVDWPAGPLAAVASTIGRYDFLDRYARGA